MKKNNKGFMLVEVIITATVIITALVGLYSNFSRIYSRYNERSNYYSIDGIYATKTMISYLMDTDFNTFVNNSLESNIISFIIKNGTCQGTIDNTLCQNIKNLYNIKNMFFTEYDNKDLEEFKNNNTINETFKDYIKYVVGHYDIENSNTNNTDSTIEQKTEYRYIFFTEIESDNQTTYANLRIR